MFGLFVSSESRGGRGGHGECGFVGMSDFGHAIRVFSAGYFDSRVRLGFGRGEDDGGHVSWSFFYSPMFFVLLVENVSVFFAFAGLLKFYHAVRDELAW